MKFSEIISLAYDCDCMPKNCTDTSLFNFATKLLRIERERCATILEAKLYPISKNNQYQEQYNVGILEDINKIKHPESYAS